MKIFYIIWTYLIMFTIFVCILSKKRSEKFIYTYKWTGDIHYLNHDFSDPTVYSPDMLKCRKCNICVHYNHNTNRYNAFDPERLSGSTYPTLTMTCEEYIIKNIIE